MINRIMFTVVVFCLVCVKAAPCQDSFPDTILTTMVAEAMKPVYQFNVAIVIIDGEKIVCKTRTEYLTALKIYENVRNLKIARSESKMTPEQYMDSVAILVSNLK